MTSSEPARKWWKARWVQFAAVFVVGLGIGGAAGGGNAVEAEKRAAAAEAEVKAARAEADEATRRATEAQYAAADAKDQAMKELAEERAALEARARQIGAAESAAQANSFPGNGMYLVGTDVKPGVYRAAASEGCYWARLRSGDTNDIIDNGNTDGQVILTIKASDHAIEVTRCGTFQRVK